jgi:hypothetical protein
VTPSHPPKRAASFGAATTVLALLALLVPLGLGLAGPLAAAAQAAPAPVVPHAALRTPRGYWLATAGGHVMNYGSAVAAGSVPGAITKPVVGIATSPLDNGYWLAAADGGVFAFGLPFLGSAGGIKLNRPVVGIAASPTGSGYWLVASDGGIFNYGVAFDGSAGSLHLNAPIVGMAATPDGGGYWLVAADGGIFSYGDAGFFGSTGSLRLNSPIVGMAATPDGRGYWLVAADGGIFSYGDAGFFGSAGSTRLVKPITGMATTPSGKGYWLVAADGGVFSYGDAAFFGSAAGHTAQAVVGIAAAPNFVTGVTGIFYYPWYGTPTSTASGGWLHWDQGGHTPPYDIGSSFYPTLGAYSSTDTATVSTHMSEIHAAGINQIIVSWWGRGSYEDEALSVIQPIAAAYGLDVAVHLEPYAPRSVASVGNDLTYLMGKGITEFYVYEADNSSLGMPAASWATLRAAFPTVTLFASGGVGDTKDGSLAAFAAAGGFDGIYTYDPVNYQGSDFAPICAGARADGLLCAPSVAPGFDATRATSNQTVVPRDGGARYDAEWAGAIAAAPDLITITSFNEWHEGSQIEPAQPFCIPNQGTCYQDYTGAYGLPDPQAQNAYLARTAFWSAQYRATVTPPAPAG